MKTKSLFFSLLLTVTGFVVFTGCSGNKKDEATNKTATAREEISDKSMESNAPQFEVSKDFQQQLGGVFTSYVEMKEAFVSSDAEKVKTQATGTSEAVAKVDMKLLSGPAHNDWMTYLAPIEKALKEIQTSSDIGAQRKAFSVLSDNLYKSIKAFGLGGKEAFYEYCPMAFNNEGGYWLSDQEKIRNPYFGDEMLTCGEVKERLK